MSLCVIYSGPHKAGTAETAVILITFSIDLTIVSYLSIPLRMVSVPAFDQRLSLDLTSISA